MAVWKNIKRVRTDMSDFVVHTTRGVMPLDDLVFERLKSILQDGFFKAGFAKRHSKPTVKGPYPAVCFTEQPLQFLSKSASQDRNRYTKFAVAVRKDELFQYGGRPVIYSDWSTLDQLPKDLQYLGVHYDPTVLWKSNSPVDFTHEREWRVRPHIDQNSSIGLDGQFISSDSVVPIHLPGRDYCLIKKPKFVVLVPTEKYKMKLIGWIDENIAAIAQKGTYWQIYAIALGDVAQTRILSFEEVENSTQYLGRIEDFIESDD